MADFREKVRELIRLLPEVERREGEPMCGHTSFRIGGRTALMLLPRSAEELERSFVCCRKLGVAPLIIGNGTNLLVEEGELELAVIKTHGGLEGVRLLNGTEIEAESGALLARIAVFAMEHSLTGLEFAHGIPGSVGGAAVMNAGAYGGEMKDVIVRTLALDEQGREFTLTGAEHDFSYRHSAFTGGDVVLKTVIRLEKGDGAAIRGRMEELMAKRRASQPLNYPSAGSTFKRPAGGYAAALIDEAGLKGYRVGGAMVSEKHAGFVINAGGATFDDVLAVMEHVRETVFRRYGIELEPEVRIIRGRS